MRAGNAIYSISKGELLDWLNSLLGTHYMKVEETSNGAPFCQILDAIYPNDIKLNKVNFNPTNENQILSNYKILQSSFDKHGIERYIPVPQLIKGTLMATLETLQWFKAFYDEKCNGEEYDGARRREEVGCNGPSEKSQAKSKPHANFTQFNAVRQTPAVRQARTAKNLNSAKKPIQTPATTSKSTTLQHQQQQNLIILKEKVEQLKSDNQTLLDERNFYYDKLQAVEQLCLKLENDDFAKQILDVLYQTDEEHGFVSPDELDI
ncbi:microtubule integrity protein mal3 [Tritrichomonas musculus]|uniref:Microtubule integrity protein mal3 n=1 Tax=Tritrichomonas musculus TaxID=1915356 RepID=A0ABR2H7E5_9EUKA